MNKRGFTLIELMVAVSIIGILSALGLSAFQGIQGKTRDSIRKNDLHTLAVALEIYFQKNGEYIPNINNCETNPTSSIFYNEIKGYLNSPSVPKDPSTSAAYCYLSFDGTNYTLCANLENTTGGGITPNACNSSNYNFAYSTENYIAAQQSQDTQFAPPPFTPAPSSSSPNPSPTTTSLRVFVTSGSYTGNLGRLYGADQKCQQAANSVPALRDGLWRAWLSSGTQNAKDRIHDSKYVRISGGTIANSKQDLINNNLLLAINTTETGGVPSTGTSLTGEAENAPYVWTGTDSNGNSTGNVCGDWDRPETANGTVGNSTASGANWTNQNPGTDQCQTLRRHIYCFEQLTPKSTGGAGCLSVYQDYDDDGYTLGETKYFCGVSSIPYGYKNSPSSSIDCYDYNPNAKPGQTQYFSTPRGDNSFDYDCSGQATPSSQYPKKGISCGTYSVSTSSSCIGSFSSQACLTNGSATTASDCGVDGSYTDNSPVMYQDDESGCSLALGNKYQLKLPCR